MPRHRAHPPRIRLLATGLLALGLVAPLVACGAEGEARGGGGGTSAPSTTVATGPLDLPADQVVWETSSGGGMAPPSPVAPHLASLTIYGDGRAFRTVAPSNRSHLDAVPIEVGTVAPDDLAALVDASEASGLFESDETDFGDPQITDATGTVVRFHGRGDAVRVSAYAFREGDEGGLTEAQRDRRSTLRDLLAEADGAATGFEPWTPDRVAVAELAERSMFGDADGRPTRWPGPAFDTFLEPTEQYGAAGCGELTGEAARAAWSEALTYPGTTWEAGDDQRELVLAALLPGQEPCAEP